VGTYRYEQAQTDISIRKCIEVRRAVFVEEQGVAEELEVDGLDDQCIHFLCRHTQENFNGGLTTIAPVAAGRILPRGDIAKIQRVAVLESHRKGGTGRGIMEYMLEFARKEGFGQAVLGSQVEVIVFYEKLGFVPFGNQYEEAGIQHQNMRLAL